MSEVPSTSQGSEGTSAPESPGMTQQRGRPTKIWQDLAERSGKRKAQDMLTQSGPSELLYAASQGAFKKNNDLKYFLKFAMMTPSRPTKIRKLMTKTDNRSERFTQDEALSLFIESDMTKKNISNSTICRKTQKSGYLPIIQWIKGGKKAMLSRKHNCNRGLC